MELNAGRNASMDPQRTTEITSQIMQVGDEIARTEKLLQELTQALSGVSRCYPPTPDKQMAEVSPALCPVAEQLRTYQRSLVRINQDISGIVSRLEI